MKYQGGDFNALRARVRALSRTLARNPWRMWLAIAAEVEPYDRGIAYHVITGTYGSIEDAEQVARATARVHDGQEPLT